MQHPIFIKAIQKVLQELQDAIPNFSNEDAKKFFDSIYAKAGMHSSVRKAIGDILTQMAQDLSESGMNQDIISQMVDLFRDSGIDVKFLDDMISFLKDNGNKDIQEAYKKRREKKDYYINIDDATEFSVLKSDLFSKHKNESAYGTIGMTANYWYLCDYFGDSSFKARAQIEINGNEDFIRAFENEIRNETFRSTEDFSRRFEAFKAAQGKHYNGGVDAEIRITADGNAGMDISKFQEESVPQSSRNNGQSSGNNANSGLEGIQAAIGEFDSIYSDAPAVQRECEEIKAKAIANGTFMKAPNGKQSKLDERQWLHVRTKAFKEWFGDWELAAKVLNIVKSEAKHGFNNFKEARAWAKKNIVRTLTNEETGGKGEIRISNTAIAKYLSDRTVNKSSDKDVHLSVLKSLPEIIRESVDAEQHPSYNKDIHGNRSIENGINPDITIHRLYGAVNIGNQIYRVKITLKAFVDPNETTKAYSYEATKIELLTGTLVDSNNTTYPSASNSITGANLLNNVEKSHKPGEKLLDVSKVVDENGEPKVVYRNMEKPYTTMRNNTFFTDSKKYADGFEYGYTGEYFLNIRNPYDISERGEDGFAKHWTLNTGNVNEYLESEESANFDGIFGCDMPFDPEHMSRGTEYVIRKPNQAKSATDNNGQYSRYDDNIEHYKTSRGEIYAFVDKKGDMYIDETKISPEHLVYEYTHLWDRAVQQRNPELWNRGVKLMKQLSLWQEILCESRSPESLVC